jgi:hypothetical protein
MLYFSYPFIKEERYKSDPFVYTNIDYKGLDRIQRNGGAFRIILTSVLYLIEQKSQRKLKPGGHQNDALLKILSLLFDYENMSDYTDGLFDFPDLKIDIKR